MAWRPISSAPGRHPIIIRNANDCVPGQVIKSRVGLLIAGGRCMLYSADRVADPEEVAQLEWNDLGRIIEPPQATCRKSYTICDTSGPVYSPIWFSEDIEDSETHRDIADAAIAASEPGKIPLAEIENRIEMAELLAEIERLKSELAKSVTDSAGVEFANRLLSSEVDRLQVELAAAPRWVPLDRERRGLGTRLTGNSGDGSICEARQFSDGTWRSTETRLLVTVTHILENTKPPKCESCSGTGCEVVTPQAPIKRGRGRPMGSRNKQPRKVSDDPAKRPGRKTGEHLAESTKYFTPLIMAMRDAGKSYPQIIAELNAGQHPHKVPNYEMVKWLVHSENKRRDAAAAKPARQSSEITIAGGVVLTGGLFAMADGVLPEPLPQNTPTTAQR